MRWPVFFIFAYLILAAQVGAAPQFEVDGARCNFVVLAVIASGSVTGALGQIVTRPPP